MRETKRRKKWKTGEVEDKFNISSLWFNQIRVRSSNKQMQTCKVLLRAIYASWTNYGAKKATRFLCELVVGLLLHGMLSTKKTWTFPFIFVQCSCWWNVKIRVVKQFSQWITATIATIFIYILSPKSDCIFHITFYKILFFNRFDCDLIAPNT